MTVRAPLRIVGIDDAPLHEVRYLNAARRGGSEVTRLSILRARAVGLPDELDAIVATSDLQGVVPDPRTRESELLGISVAEALEDLGFERVIPRAARTGVILAGDLYSLPSANKRGGFGNVVPVWEAFADRFAWVLGVAGNHDDVSAVQASATVQVLDTASASLDGLRVAGVGLISGDPARPGRRQLEDHLACIDLVAQLHPDILVLHEGPRGDDDQIGNPEIRALLERWSVGFTICGHSHWSRPLATHAAGQVLSVDGRAVVLTRA